jgi:hypothetical protein
MVQMFHTQVWGGYLLGFVHVLASKWHVAYAESMMGPFAQAGGVISQSCISGLFNNQQTMIVC